MNSQKKFSPSPGFELGSPARNSTALSTRPLGLIDTGAIFEGYRVDIDTRSVRHFYFPHFLTDFDDFCVYVGVFGVEKSIPAVKFTILCDIHGLLVKYRVSTI